MIEKIVDIRQMLDNIPYPSNNTRTVGLGDKRRAKISFDDYGG